MIYCVKAFGNLKNKIFVIAGTILTGIGLWSLHQQTVVRNPDSDFKTIKRSLFLQDNGVTARFELSKDSYLLKVRHIVSEGQSREILFNGLEVIPYNSRKCDNGDTESYMRLPRELVKQGENIITLNYPNNPPISAAVGFLNYRKHFRDFYILFSDSNVIYANRMLVQLPASVNVQILILGVLLCLRNNSFGRHLKRLLFVVWCVLVLFFGFLSLLLWYLRYALVVIPELFWGFASVILVLLFVSWLYSSISSLCKITDSPPTLIKWIFEERRFDIRTGVLFAILIIAVNLWVYWPSFFHIFRHDEWFLFFSSKDKTPDARFIVDYFDWQLKLPYDRLNFRLLLTGVLAVNRVVFGDNYTGPHVMAFIKHITATFLLWSVLWNIRNSWLSFLFALLFSVLLTGADPVMWPHIDAYTMTAAFILAILLVFDRIAAGKVPPKVGLYAVSILIFLGLLVTQVVLVMPFAFAAYLFIFRRKNNLLKTGNKIICSFLFMPLFLWGVCYSIHLKSAYPLNMTRQSDMVSLWKIAVNAGHFVLLALSSIMVPVNSVASLSDKMYVHIAGGVFLLVALPAAFILLRKAEAVEFKGREIILPALILAGMVGLICLTRASYIESVLADSNLPSYCTYSVNAVLMLLIYKMINFAKFRRIPLLQVSLLAVFAFLIFSHALKTRAVAETIARQTYPLKKYFDTVSTFISLHKNEPDFSFKMLDRPPEVKIFPWYSETCIDGLFNRFINNQTPKYVLEYDYTSERLKYSLYNNTPPSITAPNTPAVGLTRADHVNSVGMQFKKVPWRKYNLFMSMFEVTQKQWKKVMGFNPSRFVNDDNPVENVSFYMVQDFINRLNEMEGGDFYRLPLLEEYRCLEDLGFSGTKSESIGQFAWLKNNSEGRSHSVGLLAPVGDAFYDLFGNVWEWTGTPIHSGSPARDFQGNPRICFGGSWRDGEDILTRLSNNYPPDFRHEHLGFRLVIVKD